MAFCSSNFASPSPPATPPANPTVRYEVLELPAVQGITDLGPTGVNATGDIVGMYSLPCAGCGAGTSAPGRSFLFDAATEQTCFQGARAVEPSPPGRLRVRARSRPAPFLATTD